MTVESGSGVILVGEMHHAAEPGLEVTIKPREWHQIIAETDLVIREMQTGHCLEEDIVRKEV